MHDRTNYRVGFWLAVGAAFGFSAKAVFVKLSYQTSGGVDAVTLLALRMLIAAPAFGIAAMQTRSAGELTAKQWGTLVIVGLAGYYGASILDFWGLQFISAGLERLILFTYPSLTLIIGVIFLRERISRRDIISLSLTYLGIAAAFAHDLEISTDAKTVWLGGGLVFASSLSYAIYLVGGGKLIGILGSGRFTALAMAVATLATLLHYLLSRPVDDVLSQSWEIYGLAAGMALFSTVIPVFMQSAAIKHIGAARASMIGMLGPVATLAMSWLILREAVSSWQIAGVALVLIGVAVLGKK